MPVGQNWRLYPLLVRVRLLPRGLWLARILPMGREMRLLDVPPMPKSAGMEETAYVGSCESSTKPASGEANKICVLLRPDLLYFSRRFPRLYFRVFHRWNSWGWECPRRGSREWSAGWFHCWSCRGCRKCDNGAVVGWPSCRRVVF